MPKTKLFIGSSSASKSQAKAIVNAFSSPTLAFLPWWEAFTPGKTLLENLDDIGEKVDGALLLFSPESESVIRGGTKTIPNLNVLMEFGFFYGRFGRQKVAVIKYGEFYLPSDFGGYVTITGSKHFRPSGVTQVGKRTKNEFGRWIEQM